jgi:uncharacterized protein (DUF1499 family)
LRFYEHSSRKAAWSYRLSALALLVFLGAFLWHRFMGLPTPLALKILGAAAGGALVSLVLAVAALVSIWNEGYQGAGRAFFAVLLDAAVLAVPLWSLPNLLTLPRLYEVTTDPASPPAFDRIARIRQGLANPSHYNAAFIPLQTAAYPDIKPLFIQRPIVDVYTIVRDAVKALNWKVVDEQTPEAAKNGYMEAVARTLLFGFTDDVAIRVTALPKGTRIDIRSSSRFGGHDLGRNAQHIRSFTREVRVRLADLEKNERIERVVAGRLEDNQKSPPGARPAKRRNEDD